MSDKGFLLINTLGSHVVFRYPVLFFSKEWYGMNGDTMLNWYPCLPYINDETKHIYRRRKLYLIYSTNVDAHEEYPEKVIIIIFVT